MRKFCVVLPLLLEKTHWRCWGLAVPWTDTLVDFVFSTPGFFACQVALCFRSESAFIFSLYLFIHIYLFAVPLRFGWRTQSEFILKLLLNFINFQSGFGSLCLPIPCLNSLLIIISQIDLTHPYEWSWHQQPFMNLSTVSPSTFLSFLIAFTWRDLRINVCPLW